MSKVKYTDRMGNEEILTRTAEKTDRSDIKNILVGVYTVWKLSEAKNHKRKVNGKRRRERRNVGMLENNKSRRSYTQVKEDAQD